MGTNKKQTAVQQLWDELEELNLPNWQRDFRPILMKAKQMEKQQIIEANEAGFNDAELIDYKYEGKNPEDYFNETYNTETDGL